VFSYSQHNQEVTNLLVKKYLKDIAFYDNYVTEGYSGLALKVGSGGCRGKISTKLLLSRG
jgi:hypothetical protein